MIDESVLRRVLSTALRTGGDFAEVFVEDRSSSSAMLDDGRAEAFLEMLTERFDAPVEIFDPFKKVAIDAKRFQVDMTDMAPTAAVAVGLALRRASDR